MSQSFKGTRSPVPYIVVMAVVVLVLAWGSFFLSMGKPIVVTVTIPELSTEAAAGRIAFNTHCSECHGKDGIGDMTGPPMLYPFYRPADFPDERFGQAVREGAPKRLWKMGSMKAMPEVSEAEIKAMLLYVREAQAANGMGHKDG